MAWYLMGAIFLTGLWGVLRLHNMVKKVMALNISNSAIILLFLYHGSLSGSTAPIETVPPETGLMVDPLPQALMLTAIVVGVCIMALALALTDRLYQIFGSVDIRRIESEAWRLHD